MMRFKRKVAGVSLRPANREKRPPKETTTREASFWANILLMYARDGVIV